MEKRPFTLPIMPMNTDNTSWRRRVFNPLGVFVEDCRAVEAGVGRPGNISGYKTVKLVSVLVVRPFGREDGSSDHARLLQ